MRETGTERRSTRRRPCGPHGEAHSILLLQTDESHRKQQGAAATARPPAFCGSECRDDGLRP
ncbi:hypothetical protein D8I24_1523 [Cupriavidus necator H850]|nr:hypothetical protein D8I24_1523 [Cupriavidus necator H850]